MLTIQFPLLLFKESESMKPVERLCLSWQIRGISTVENNTVEAITVVDKNFNKTLEKTKENFPNLCGSLLL